MGTLATGQAANRPYKVAVTNGAGLSVTSTATIGFAGLSWTSPAAGATLSTFFTGTAANNTELAATDDVGGSGVTYSLVSANLPLGLTINTSTGAITGTIAAVTAAGGVSVTFRVTDTMSGATLDRTFSIVGAAPLYTFTSGFTFVVAQTLYASGTNRHKNAVGPTLTQLRAAYSSDSWTHANASGGPFLNILGQGVQLWTVPVSGLYRIDAYGAVGGSTQLYYGGQGARIRGDFQLIEGEIIRIVVGQTGNWGPHTQSTAAKNASGGGGTFVVRSPYNTDASILVIAGGGGGASDGPWHNSAGKNAQTGTAGSSGGTSYYVGGTGGWGGGGGLGGGGAGFHNAPGNGYTNPILAKAFTDGGTNTASYLSGLNHSLGGGGSTNWGTYPNHLSYGGFGGGGGGGGLASGGGGGYSGGGAGNWSIDSQGGGGGSYNNGIPTASQINATRGTPSGGPNYGTGLAYNSGYGPDLNGKVIITIL
jgi:hypothetical protein